MQKYRKEYYSKPENKERQRFSGKKRRQEKSEEIAKYAFDEGKAK